MTPNVEFKQFRKELNLTQMELAEALGVTQGTITDIERGRIKVSKNVKAKIFEKYSIEAGYFKDGIKVKNTVLKQGDETGGRQGIGTINYAYLTKFKDFLDRNHPEYNKLSSDISDILSISEVIDVLHDTKIGDPIFLTIENLRKIKSFKELKDTGLQAYTEAFKYNDIIHEFALACRKFVTELSKIKDDIDMDYDFEEWLS